MKMNRTPKLLWGGLAAAAILGAVWQTQKLPDAAHRLHRLPARTLFVDSRDMPLTPSEEALFKNTTVVKRLAVAHRMPVILTAVDGTRNRHAIHDPAFCFRGAGWEIASQETLPLEAGEARLLHLQKGEDRAEAVYWFSTGQAQFAKPLRYWWETALRRLTLGRSGPEPVLVMLASTSSGTPDWPRLLRDWPDLQAL